MIRWPKCQPTSVGKCGMVAEHETGTLVGEDVAANGIVMRLDAIVLLELGSVNRGLQSCCETPWRRSV